MIDQQGHELSDLPKHPTVKMGTWRDWKRGGWAAWCDGHEARAPSEAEAIARACEMRIAELITTQAASEH